MFRFVASDSAADSARPPVGGGDFRLEADNSELTQRVVCQVEEEMFMFVASDSALTQRVRQVGEEMFRFVASDSALTQGVVRQVEEEVHELLGKLKVKQQDVDLQVHSVSVIRG
jgi:hypothetical protein